MGSSAQYPALRHRRKRRWGWIREMVAEHRLSAADLIYPIFVHGGSDAEPIPSMPGIERVSVEGAKEVAKRAADLGIPALAIFPVVDSELKTDAAEEAWNPIT